MNDQRVTDKLMRIRSSVQLNYPKHEIVEQGYHGTSRLGVFFLILKCPTTHYYLSFMWRMQDRRVIFGGVNSDMRHDEAQFRPESLYRYYKQIFKALEV